MVVAVLEEYPRAESERVFSLTKVEAVTESLTSHAFHAELTGQLDNPKYATLRL